jgi:transposase
LRCESDLRNAYWQTIEPCLPPPSEPGRPQSWPWRQIVNAIFYVRRSGRPWRLPKDFPIWWRVYRRFSAGRDTGLFAMMSHARHDGHSDISPERIMISQFDDCEKMAKRLYMYVGETGKYGLGLFTARYIAKGEFIKRDDASDYYGQRIYTYAELVSMNLYIYDLFQIGRDAFVMPKSNIDDFMNHSCDPNCGIRLTREEYIVLALRDIRRGEELTYDYSTHQLVPAEGMPCRCGAANCRQTVENFDRLPAALRARYIARGIVGDFVTEPDILGVIRLLPGGRAGA